MDRRNPEAVFAMGLQELGEHRRHAPGDCAWENFDFGGAFGAGGRSTRSAVWQSAPSSNGMRRTTSCPAFRPWYTRARGASATCRSRPFFSRMVIAFFVQVFTVPRTLA